MLLFKRENNSMTNDWRRHFWRTYFCNIKGIKNNLLLFNIRYISGLEYSRKQQNENEKNIFSFEPTVLIFSRSICVKFKENLLAIHVLSLFAACSFLLTVNSPNLFKTYSKLAYVHSLHSEQCILQYWQIQSVESFYRAKRIKKLF